MNPSDINILIGCEESQTVCKAFRARGFNAFSCDIEPCSGGHPEWHIQQDVLEIINPHQISNSFYGIVFRTVDGEAYKIKNGWDLIIFHPPCTFLTCAGNRWYNVEKYGDKARQRLKDREEAVEFFMKLYNTDCPYIAVENPQGIMSTRFRKPDQYIQPYEYGDPARKTTGLWLKGLPCLKPTNIVEPDLITFVNAKGQTRTMDRGISGFDTLHLPPKERARVRSKTYQGIADAMASQWGDFILKIKE